MGHSLGSWQTCSPVEQEDWHDAVSATAVKSPQHTMPVGQSCAPLQARAKPEHAVGSEHDPLRTPESFLVAAITQQTWPCPHVLVPHAMLASAPMETVALSVVA